MNGDRWIVLGLAHPRAAWFRDLARWSSTAVVPVDFVKCASPNEVRARIRGGRAYSALLVGGDVSGLDRDLVETVRSAGAAVIAVDPTVPRGWTELGVAAVLPAAFGRDDLLTVLADHAVPISAVASLPHPEPVDEPSWRGRLIAVVGSGGVGASITAMSIAQAFGAEPSNHAMVVLADLALHAEQGMLHDARELSPGIQELTEAHRAARPPIDVVRSLTFEVEDRGYHLMLGLRRHRDWTAIRPRAFDAALDGLLRSYRIVVADVDADTEGEHTTGSIDVEDRNTMARSSITRADLVVAVGNPSTKGLHSLARLVRSTRDHGVDPARIVPLCARAAKGARRRAEAVRALAALLSGDADPVGNPVFTAERGDLEDALRDGFRLPPQVGRPIHRELTRRLESLSPRRFAPDPSLDGSPVPVVPGSLGAWAEEAG
ncbi:MAG: hypothetical protein RIB98_06285 [Acidimicrobiales bacterium]